MAEEEEEEERGEKEGFSLPPSHRRLAIQAVSVLSRQKERSQVKGPPSLVALRIKKAKKEGGKGVSQALYQPFFSSLHAICLSGTHRSHAIAARTGAPKLKFSWNEKGKQQARCSIIPFSVFPFHSSGISLLPFSSTGRKKEKGPIYQPPSQLCLIALSPFPCILYIHLFPPQSSLVCLSDPVLALLPCILGLCFLFHRNPQDR